MDTRQVIDSFWAAMRANEWTLAAEHFAQDCPIDWPCSGERIRGPREYAEVQARYPTRTGVWSFDIHQIICEKSTAVSEVTASDGDQAGRVIAFSTVTNGKITRQVEYWPVPYDPPAGREDLVESTNQVP